MVGGNTDGCLVDAGVPRELACDVDLELMVSLHGILRSV
jgi:hypothetical protein